MQIDGGVFVSVQTPGPSSIKTAAQWLGVHVGRASVHGRLVPGDPDPNKMRWRTVLKLTGRKLRLTTCRGRDIYRWDNHPGSGLLGSKDGCEREALRRGPAGGGMEPKATSGGSPPALLGRSMRPANPSESSDTAAGLRRFTSVSPRPHAQPGPRPRPVGPAASLLHSLQTDVDPANLSSLAQPPSIMGLSFFPFSSNPLLSSFLKTRSLQEDMQWNGIQPVSDSATYRLGYAKHKLASRIGLV